MEAGTIQLFLGIIRGGLNDYQDYGPRFPVSL